MQKLDRIKYIKMSFIDNILSKSLFKILIIYHRS